ncbi:TniQ family protein [Salinarimonas soli]|uniref:TniQ domain-containing protein n=1 Tax=Salinarimonas soli TaxID=1638099 RepID=A0A5B2VA46_9HYPH|nr:TniQ family protein [Salinarimonas soli]KAA2235864.1 hypothetical protein F0L46_17640 [Salinarimonas soli]
MIASDTRLTVVPTPIPGESGPGYLMRAFSINGQGWSRDQFRVSGFSIAAVVHGDLAGPVRAYLGCEGVPDCLVSPVVTGTRVALFGEELHRDDWTSRQRRWCPDCWRGDLSAAGGQRRAYWGIYRRPWWDVTAISACPTHRVRLAAHYPDCGEGVSWHYGSLTRCRNGHDLLRCEAVALDADDCRADAYLAGRLGGAPRVACDALDGLTLVDAVAAMERLGAAWLDENAGMARLRAELGRGALMNAGHRVAADLPRHAVSLLDRVRAGTDGRRRGWGSSTPTAGCMPGSAPCRRALWHPRYARPSPATCARACSSRPASHSKVCPGPRRSD